MITKECSSKLILMNRKTSTSSTIPYVDSARREVNVTLSCYLDLAHGTEEKQCINELLLPCILLTNSIFVHATVNFVYLSRMKNDLMSAWVSSYHFIF